MEPPKSITVSVLQTELNWKIMLITNMFLQLDITLTFLMYINPQLSNDGMWSVMQLTENEVLLYSSGPLCTKGTCKTLKLKPLYVETSVLRHIGPPLGFIFGSLSCGETDLYPSWFERTEGSPWGKHWGRWSMGVFIGQACQNTFNIVM